MFTEGSIERDELERMRQVHNLYAGDARKRDLIYSDIIGAAVGIVFGAIHCIAWPFEFPSHAELILWQISSISIAVLIVLLLFFFCIGLAVGLEKKVIVSVLLPCIILYAVGRLIQLTLALTTLRSLPSGAYRVVQWVNIIPHIGA